MDGRTGRRQRTNRARAWQLTASGRMAGLECCVRLPAVPIRQAGRLADHGRTGFASRCARCFRRGRGQGTQASLRQARAAHTARAPPQTLKPGRAPQSGGAHAPFAEAARKPDAAAREETRRRAAAGMGYLLLCCSGRSNAAAGTRPRCGSQRRDYRKTGSKRQPDPSALPLLLLSPVACMLSRPACSCPPGFIQTCLPPREDGRIREAPTRPGTSSKVRARRRPPPASPDPASRRGDEDRPASAQLNLAFPLSPFFFFGVLPPPRARCLQLAVRC